MVSMAYCNCFLLVTAYIAAAQTGQRCLRLSTLSLSFSFEHSQVLTTPAPAHYCYPSCQYAMWQVAPTAMLFIPCFKGYSHRPDEYATPADIEHGVQVHRHRHPSCLSAPVTAPASEACSKLLQHHV